MKGKLVHRRKEEKRRVITGGKNKVPSPVKKKEKR